MASHPRYRRRNSMRWQGYDYSLAGAYYVTVCAQNRACLFGDIIDGAMHQSPVGQAVQRAFEELPGRFPTLVTDALAIMPNHVHLILLLLNEPSVVGRSLLRPTGQMRAEQAPPLLRPDCAKRPDQAPTLRSAT